jgi:Integrase core domain
MVRLVHVTTVPQSLTFFQGQVGYLKARGMDVWALSSPGELLDQFAAREGVPVHGLEMPRRITPHAQRGTYPAVLRCDNGPELACAAMADWAHGHLGLHFIPPGEPWRNGYVESFNSRIRDECLNINSFWSLARPGWSSATGSTTTTTTDAIPPSVTSHRAATLPPAFINVHRMRPVG